MAFFTNNRNNGIPAKKAASTDFTVGMFVSPDGSGAYIPSADDVAIFGVCNEVITSADPDYADVRGLSVSTPVNLLDELVIPVTTGTADETMVGSYFDVDSGNGSIGISVSAPGTQIYVTEFIDAATVKGFIARTVANQTV